MPVPEGILQALKLRYELSGFGGFWRELGCIAGSFHGYPVFVQVGFVGTSIVEWHGVQHLTSDRQGIALRFEVGISKGAPQTFCRLANISFFQQFAELALVFFPKFQKMLRELSLTAGLNRNFKTSKGRKLRVEVPNMAGFAANPSQNFEQLFLVATGAWDQLLQ